MNAVRQGNKHDLTLALRQFKNPNGTPNFTNLFLVKSEERLPEMARKGYEDTLDLVVVGLTLAMQSINVKRGLNGEQINDLAEEIVDSAHDDNLAFEDIMIFLQGLVRGKYGELYESMDIPKFMEKFELYREERHKAIVEYRENKHLEYKALGDPTRSTKPETAFDEHLQSYTSKLQEKNDEIKLLKREARENKK